MTIRDRLFALELFGIKLGLDNMRVLSTALGHPEHAYPTVHVAGTNGKGSVCAMVARGLDAEGHRTGLYTSPHLDRLEERIVIEGSAVAPPLLDEVAEHVFDVIDAARLDGRLSVTPTFFEVTTAVALEVFRRARVDVGVIEVGLGGRFDATNIITPRVSAITSIAFDHERHLGSTLGAIAGEKAGIAKPGVPLIVGALPEEAMAVVERVAGETGAPLVRASGAAELVSLERGRARVRPHTRHWPGLPPMALSLAGRHQAANAATAVALLDTLADTGVIIGADAVEAGLTTARWPARLEWLRLGDGRLLIDAAHNPAGAAALSSYLEDDGGGPLPVVLAAMRDKDIDRMVLPLSAAASEFVATSVNMPRAFPPEVLAGRITAAVPGARVSIEPDPIAAASQAVQRHGRAVAAGSIYFVGPLRARLLESGAIPI